MTPGLSVHRYPREGGERRGGRTERRESGLCTLDFGATVGILLLLDPDAPSDIEEDQ